MYRRRFLQQAGSGFAWAGLAMTVVETLGVDGKRPNFILYLADDQNKLDYGCYGNSKVHTPAADRLAREGMKFERAYTGQAICAPSRSMLYTGDYPFRNGCFMNHANVWPDATSLILALQKLGCEVVLAGKSHVGPRKSFPWSRVWQNKQTAPQGGGRRKDCRSNGYPLSSNPRKVPIAL